MCQFCVPIHKKKKKKKKRVCPQGCVHTDEKIFKEMSLEKVWSVQQLPPFGAECFGAAILGGKSDEMTWRADV